MNARFFRLASDLEVEKYVQGENRYVDVLIRDNPESGMGDAVYIVEIGDGDGELEAEFGS